MATDPARQLSSALTCAQILFRTTAPMARVLVRRLHVGDVELAYKEMICTFTQQRFSPDHANPEYNGRSLATLARLFTTLSEFVRYTQARSTPSAPAQTSTAKGRYFSGGIPPRPLRFGAYLYYTGLISDHHLVDALAWQQRQRPLFGQVALQQEMLAPRQFAQVLVYTDKNRPFGEIARSMKVLTEPDIHQILAQQSRYNCPIGRYFIEQKLVSDTDLPAHLSSHEQHNRFCSGKSRAA